MVLNRALGARDNSHPSKIGGSSSFHTSLQLNWKLHEVLDNKVPVKGMFVSFKPVHFKASIFPLFLCFSFYSNLEVVWFRWHTYNSEATQMQKSLLGWMLPRDAYIRLWHEQVHFCYVKPLRIRAIFDTEAQPSFTLTNMVPGGNKEESSLSFLLENCVIWGKTIATLEINSWRLSVHIISTAKTD